jgi:hypothetical protein
MRRIARHCLLMLNLILVVTACSARSRSAVSNPNLITEAEIRAEQDAGVRDLYELIQRTHPRWLQGRTDRSINLETVILVYQNQQMLGGTDVLRGFPLANIRSIRYLDAAQAGQLPGTGGRHVEAAIVISTR